MSLSFRSFEISEPGAAPDGLRFVTVKSAALRARADLTLFVPPEVSALRDVPIVILLHGVYGSHWAWALQGRAHLTARRLMAQGDIPPLVLAMPSDGLWGDGSGYVPHQGPDFERWIVDEVPAVAVRASPACSERSPLCVAGLSMGGFGALRLAGKYPARWVAAAGHSSVTEAAQLDALVAEGRSGWSAADRDQSVLAALVQASAPLPRLRLDCGVDDPFIAANRRLHAELQDTGIAHEYAEHAGGHEWGYWARHIEDTLRFFAASLPAMLLALWLTLLLALVAPGPARAGAVDDDLARWVDPFIGTDGTGHVLPGATRPFGMVAPGPDNATGGWDYTSGYQYRAPKILGFSNTHMSGTGIPDLGDVLLQPASGTPWSEHTLDFASPYDKATERAQPGSYAVKLGRHGVRVELTATQRVALHRYTFRRGGAAQVLVDLQHGLQYGDAPRVLAADVRIDSAAREVSGTVHVKGWTEREVSFVLRFDRPIAKVRTLPPRPGDKAPRLLLDFDLGPQRMLQARVALSTVDVAGARANLAQADALSFDRVQAEARREWNGLLSRARIEAPARFKRIFYSALYRTFMHPSDIADADGRVRGPTGAVIQAPEGRYYSTLSLWDTFRGLHPLLTLLVPERVDGFIQTLIAHQQAQGYLPLWTAWGRETHTMIGNPALPVIADAVAKGFEGFDREQALQAMLQTATAERPAAPPWAQHGWSLLDEFGYLPFDRADGEAVSKTLEYGIGDDAVARVARALGRSDPAERFGRRAQSWRQLWDEGTQMMRGKDSQGRWRTPFDPLVPTSPLNNPGDYTEANAWQYTLTPALHDPQGLVAQMGGPRRFEAWLDRFFTVQAPSDNKHLGQEALIGQYAHGNEPSHHAAYLYAFTPAPWKGHALVRRIVRSFYTDRPDGITGNDDCGQMSAWLVLSTLGFYPVVVSGGEYVLGAPQVRSAQLTLASGRPLRIRAAGFGPGRPWASEVTLDGAPVDRLALRHADLLRGGVLLYRLRPLP